MSLAGFVMIGSLTACGDDGRSAPTSITGSTTTSTTTPATTTAGEVVAWIQAQLDQQYAESTPVSGVTGPSQLACRDTGPIDVGGVLACELRPQTEPGFDLEAGGVIIYLLDASGRAAFDVATDIPDSTADLIARFAEVPRGLYCHELLDPEVNAHPFSQRSTPATNFLWSLVYWSLEGEPNRMDEDQNGIPCETLYDPEVVADVLGGGSIQ